jgi:hypothetical protein
MVDPKYEPTTSPGSGDILVAHDGESWGQSGI